MDDKPVMTDAQIAAAHVSGIAPLAGPIEIVSYDHEWPVLFQREAAAVQAALDGRLVLLEHIGSTSVPGLAAKPVIDIVIAVANSADELAYVPDLEAAGYTLCVREPDWHEHRMFRRGDREVHLHIFSSGSSEIARMVLFRDWLRHDDADRELYERSKRELATLDWKFVQNYADAKTPIVEAILARARATEEQASA